MGSVSREQAFALARALIAESPAAETEVTVDAIAERFVRFAAPGPTQDADRERVDVAVRVRVARDGGFSEARAETGSTEPAALRAALARAIEVAGSAPVEPDLVPLGGPATVTATRAAAATRAHDFAGKAAWIAPALERARDEGFEPAGLAQTLVLARAIVNSRGREVAGELGRASFSLALEGPDSSGFAEAIGPDAATLDAAGVVERAVRKARASARPRAIDPGDYEVVLEPPAASALLLFLAYQGFGARDVLEQVSFLCGRVGAQVFSPALSIADDAACPLNPGLPFDAEGTPRRRLALVERGRVLGPATDRATAALSGGESTGHAQPQPSIHGPLPQNLVVEAGAAGSGELIAGVRRGLLISQMHYVNAIDARELVLTGVTRHGTWLVEDGRIVGPVGNLRFSDSLLTALARVRAVGSERELAGALFEGEVVTPALHLEKLRFTSAADSWNL